MMIKSTRFPRGFDRCALAMALAAVAATTHAQPGAEKKLELDEVVVTAERREQSLQDTPVSIVALGAADLESKGIRDIVELRTSVPNFQLAPHPTSSSTVRLFMRGVGNNDDQITQDPSVAIYLDGAYIARSQGLAMEVADLERVEVLRGPQGALYGRNATGGAINFITRKPDLDEWGFSQGVSIGNRSLVRTLTRANIPLIEGRLAAGIAYLYSKQDGFIDNAGSGSDHYADRDRDGLRLDVLWAISDAVELRYAYDRSTIADSPAFLAKVNPLTDRPKIPHRGSIYDQLKDSDITADGHSLTLTWQLSEKVELKSLTTYRELESNVQNNMMTDTYSRFPGRPVIASLGDLDQDQFSQEFQITGDAFGGQLEYVAGLYYFKESGDNTGFTRTGNFIPVPITAGVTISTADNEATAVFGQATYTPSALGDRLHLTLGGRWSEDKREATLVMATAAAGVITPTGMPGDGNKTYRNVSPTAVVAYDITDDVNVYVKVARGYKSGGYNTRANGIPRFNQGFKPEELTSVELGLKSQVLDNRIRFNLAVFDADYEDIQVNTSSVVGNPSITDVLNAGKAKIKGVEAELTAVLLEGLTFHANYGYLKPEYKEIIGADGVNRANVYTPINSPKNAWSLDLEYVFPWQLPGELSANLNYSWQDEMHTSTSNPTFLIPEYSLLNARLTLADVQAFGGSFRVSLWGKNLRDKEYWLSLARVIDPYALYGEPRSYGVDFTWEL